MRRALLLTASLACVLFAGCGSSSSSSSSARDTELSYFSPGAPFVGLLQTDPNGKPIQDANAFVARFPFGKLGIAALQSALSRKGIDYQRDIKPLIGNPVALGAANDVNISGSSYLLVFVAKDAAKLAALTKRSSPQQIGTYDGAKLYQSGSSTLALDGATALLSPSETDVKAALDRHAHHQGATASAFSKALSGLPQDTILQMFGNLNGVLTTPRTASARRVPWVGAIRSYGITVGVNSSGVAVRYRVDTSGATLTGDQLPLPTGSGSPSVSTQAPIAFGIQNLSHLISFVLGAEQTSSPAQYAAYLKRQAAVRAKTGIDPARDIYSQFTGNLEINYAPPLVLARAQVKDPAAAARTLTKLGTNAGQLYKTPKQVRSAGGGFYALRSGSKTINYGLVGNQLVIGTASPARLKTFAGTPAAPVAGAQGPAAFRMSVGALLSLALAARHSHTQIPAAAQSILNMFGDVTGWAANDTSGLQGSVSVALK